MKISAFSLLLCFASCLMMISVGSSCSDDETEGSRYLLEVAPTDPIVFSGDGYEQVSLSVSTTSPDGFTVTPSVADWLRIDQTENSITIIPLKDNDVQDIVGSITVSAEGAPSVTIGVTQEKTKKYEYSWKLVWSEEFEGPELDPDTWNIQTGRGNNGWGNNELQYYTDRPENLRIENGQLIIEARRETYGSANYTSARINTQDKVDFTYGRIEARISFPGGAGTWGAFWTLGSNYSTASWPLCGEIDIIEQVGYNERMLINALHTSVANGTNGVNWSSTSYHDNVTKEFHTYAIEWIEDYNNGFDCIQFYFDEHLTGTKWQSSREEDPRAWPYYKPQFILLNMAIGGNLGGAVDNSIFDNEVLMKVDYVRAYERVATEIKD